MNNKILIICGPTATGKTALGIHLANKFNGEIISADSRQVYKGMDIGTGKGLDESSRQVVCRIQGRKLSVYRKDRVRIWGYDLVDPNLDFSVAEYRKVMLPVVEDICSRAKLPIIVGGTGFYIDALVNPPETLGVQSNMKLREELSELKTQELQERLKQVDSTKFELMNNSDKNNPRRLIRAIEVANDKKKNLRITQPIPGLIKLKTLWLGLSTASEVLLQQVTENVKRRATKQFTDEIEQLEAKGFNWNSPAASATGYQEWKQYLDGYLDKRAALEKWILRETQYQKRQLTWFKKNHQINWFDVSDSNFYSSVEHQVQAWYS